MEILLSIIIAELLYVALKLHNIEENQRNK